MAPQTPPTFGAARRSRAAPRSPICQMSHAMAISSAATTAIAEMREICAALRASCSRVPDVAPHHLAQPERPAGLLPRDRSLAHRADVISLTGHLSALYTGARAVAGALALGMTHTGRERPMCRLCDEGIPPSHSASRRDFLKATAATGAAAASLNLFAPRPAAADGVDPPPDTGRPGRRYVIRGGSVMSMDPDPKVGDFAEADVLVQGKKILAVGPNLKAGDADVIDARGRIVMPGFIDTHHHQFETALRSFLANGILINDGSGSPSAKPTYYEYILLTFAPVYRPQDVYISELFGGLAQLDDGVTTVHDISQIHHSPAHSDAAIQALLDTGRRAAFGYFESAGGVAGNQYPGDALRIKKQWFSSNDQLVHMIMGGEVYLGEPTYTQAWRIGRQLGLQIAAHILSPFGIRPILDDLADGTGGLNNNIGLGPDNLFIHMTGMSDKGWQAVKDN